MDYRFLLIGFVGGMVRGLVGFVKHQFTYKNVGFKLPYFFVIIFLSGIIGLLTASFFGRDLLFSFVVGYAGGDFIENVYKTVSKKPSLYLDLK